jgi:hypothetical protein
VTARKRMTRMGAAAPLIALLILHGCGLGGGSRGSGIESIADGNVSAIQLTQASGGSRSDLAASNAAAAVPVSGVTVTVVPGGQHGLTNPAGAFLVAGSFEAEMTLLFTRASDSIRASLPIDIPAGGTLTLHDVVIDNARGAATPASQEVDFTGQFTQVQCPVLTLVMVSIFRSPGDTDSYMVRLATSTVEDQDGKPVPCSALSVGQVAHVHGTVNPDGSFGHASIIVESND